MINYTLSHTNRYIKYLIVFLTMIFTLYLISTPIYILIYSASERFPFPFLILVALFALIFFLLLSLVSNGFNKVNIYVMTLISFFLYLFWGIYASVTPYSDFGTFYTLSVQYASSLDTNILYLSKSPTTTIYYAFFVLILGKSYLTFYIASSLIWSIQIIILYKTLVNFKLLDRNAKFIALMYGLYPGIIFFSTVVSSESIFMFFLISAFYFMSKIFNNTFTKKNTIVLGILFSLFFLTRGNAIAFIIPYIIYFFFSMNSSKKDTFLFILAMILPLLFQLFLNIKYDDRFSFSSSQWSAYNLMVGTNMKSNGGYNVSDLELAGFVGETELHTV